MKKQVLDYLDRSLDSNKTEHFLGDIDGVLSRKESKNLIYQYANFLADYETQGKNSQLGIAILLPRNVDYLLAIFATWMSGHYYIPLNTNWPREHINKILAMAKPDLLITQGETDYKVRSIAIGELKKAEKPNSWRVETWIKRRKEHGLSYIIYTSGSTGEQKGVMISKKSLSSYINWTARFFSAFTENIALLQNGELNFDISIADISTVLALDLELHISPSTQNLMAHALLVKKRNIDTFYGVPSTINRLFSWIETRPDIKLDGLKLVFSGGDIVTFNMIKLVRRLAPSAHLYNMYGPTETTMNCLSIRIDQLSSDECENVVPTGHLLDHLQGYLINSQLEICDESETEGELVVGGDQCMEGYLQDKEKTKQAFVEIAGKQFYRTGDLFRRNSEGLYFFIGRSDSLVKIKGYRINTGTITNVISESEMISEACTIVVENEGEKSIVTYVTKNTNIPNIQETLLDFCKEKLPTYMLPSRIILLDQLPLGKTGKYDLGHLEELARRDQHG